MSGNEWTAGHHPLTRRQEAFLSQLCQARTLAEAAKRAHVSEATACRWLALPHVQTTYRAMRAQLVESALAGLQAASRAAVATLVRNLAADRPASVQVRAAEAILERALAATELTAVLEQLERLEQRLAEEQQEQTASRWNGSLRGGGGAGASGGGRRFYG